MIITVITFSRWVLGTPLGQPITSKTILFLKFGLLYYMSWDPEWMIIWIFPNLSSPSLCRLHRPSRRWCSGGGGVETFSYDDGIGGGGLVKEAKLECNGESSRATRFAFSSADGDANDRTVVSKDVEKKHKLGQFFGCCSADFTYGAYHQLNMSPVSSKFG